jgi:hypothetical protein
MYMYSLQIKRDYTKKKFTLHSLHYWLQSKQIRPKNKEDVCQSSALPEQVVVPCTFIVKLRHRAQTFSLVTVVWALALLGSSWHCDVNAAFYRRIPRVYRWLSSVLVARPASICSEHWLSGAGFRMFWSQDLPSIRSEHYLSGTSCRMF